MEYSKMHEHNNLGGSTQNNFFDRYEGQKNQQYLNPAVELSNKRVYSESNMSKMGHNSKFEMEEEIKVNDSQQLESSYSTSAQKKPHR